MASGKAFIWEGKDATREEDERGVRRVEEGANASAVERRAKRARIMVERELCCFIVSICCDVLFVYYYLMDFVWDAEKLCICLRVKQNYIFCTH